MFRPLSREEALEEVRLRIPEAVDEFLAPDGLGGVPVYLTDGRTVLSLALRKAERLVWIMGVHGGGLEWLFELRRLALGAGYDSVGFKVKPGTRWAVSMAKFSKARLVASTKDGDEYVASLRAR